MKGSNSYRLDLCQGQALQSELRTAGFQFSECNHAFWRATDGRYTLTLYRTGKLLIQGKDPEGMARSLIRKGFTLSDPNPVAPQRQGVSKWIGTDESGKGDYFGPLVVAGVLLTSETQKELISIGVRDPKRLSEVSINKLAPGIRDLCPHSVIAIPPRLYNKAYEAIPNYGKIYRILAWGHARVVENILERHDCRYAVVDQFARETFMKRALMERGSHITLEQRPHAEDDTAVAAAAILAREAYMEDLKKLSVEYSIPLPPGASQKVIEVGREFVFKHGLDKLGEVAKLHSKTTQAILNLGRIIAPPKRNGGKNK